MFKLIASDEIGSFTTVPGASLIDAVATKLPLETLARTLSVTAALFVIDDVAVGPRIRWR